MKCQAQMHFASDSNYNEKNGGKIARIAGQHRSGSSGDRGKVSFKGCLMYKNLD